VYKLVFFVPEEQLERVKTAVFRAGAGRIGNYDCCCWQVLGQGQFRPLKGSSPFVGSLDEIETVMEYRVEMVCQKALIEEAVAALKLAHPYEEPAWEVSKLESV